MNMTLEENTQIENITVTVEQVEDKINEWADSFIKTSDLPAEILRMSEQARLTIEQVGQLVDKALKARGLSDRQIRRIKPKELKRQYVTNRQVLDTMTESPNTEIEDIPVIYTDVRQVEPTIIPVSEERDLSTVMTEIQQAGFDFTNLPEIWTDVGAELAKEFLLPENRDKQFKILVEM